MKCYVSIEYYSGVKWRKTLYVLHWLKSKLYSFIVYVLYSRQCGRPIRLKSVWLIWFPQRNKHINKIDKITIFHILASSTSLLARWIIELFNHIRKMCSHTRLHFIGSFVLCLLYILICRHSRKVFSIQYSAFNFVCLLYSYKRTVNSTFNVQRHTRGIESHIVIVRQNEIAYKIHSGDDPNNNDEIWCVCVYDMFFCLVLLDFTVSALWMCCHLPLYSNFTWSQITLFFSFSWRKNRIFRPIFLFWMRQNTPRRNNFRLHTVCNVFKFFSWWRLWFFIFTKGTSLNLISWNFIYFILMLDSECWFNACERKK